MTMTKGDIVDRIHEKVGFSKKEASDVVESIFRIIKERLETGETVKISGFRSIRSGRARDAIRRRGTRSRSPAAAF
jgi:nucleoid DNA-binding protein